MRFNPSIPIFLLSGLLFAGMSAHAQTGQGAGRSQGAGKGEAKAAGQSKAGSQGAEKTLATNETVSVSLTTGGGRIIVRGWDRSEVRAQTRLPGSRIEMRIAGGDEAAHPIGRLEILVADKSDSGEVDYDSGDADTDVQINVPRGATVYLKTEDGDIEVDDVAEARIETTDGRIEARRIAKVFDASSVGGYVALEDAKGRARLKSLGGAIEARDLRPLVAGDFLKITTSSGDILLDRVGQARVEASTITGEVRLIGPLARAAIYTFNTTTGDVTIMLPAESSFKLNAKVSEGGEIITEFPLKYKGPTSPVTLLKAGRLMGTYGTGDATINLVSFNGTLRLRKKQ